MLTIAEPFFACNMADSVNETGFTKINSAGGTSGGGGDGGVGDDVGVGGVGDGGGDKVDKQRPPSKAKKTAKHGKDVKKLKRTAKHPSHRGFVASEPSEANEDLRYYLEFNQAYNEAVHGYKDDNVE
jgi:hypothetical protein